MKLATKIMERETGDQVWKPLRLNIRRNDKKGSTLASDHEFHYGVETAFSRYSTENCYC